MTNNISDHHRPPSPRPTYQDAEARVSFQGGRWWHDDPAEVCSSKSGHRERHTAVGCCDNSLNIQWKRNKAAAA